MTGEKGKPRSNGLGAQMRLALRTPVGKGKTHMGEILPILGHHNKTRHLMAGKREAQYLNLLQHVSVRAWEGQGQPEEKQAS